MNREDCTDKFYLIFDIRRDGYIRRLTKVDMESEAFAIDTTGKMMAFVDGPDLLVKLVRVPNSAALIDQMRPRYVNPQSRMATSAASENKQFFKDKLYRDLQTYHQFKVNPMKAEKLRGISEETNF